MTKIDTPTFDLAPTQEPAQDRPFVRNVEKVFRIDDMTLGDGSKYIVRYRGQLISEDTAAAHLQLLEELRPHDVTPLFRLEEKQQVIYIVPKAFNPRPSNVRVNILMFALTVFFVFMAGAMYGYNGPLPRGGLNQFIFFATHFYWGWQFGLSLLAILLAHEFGHYIAARRHNEPVTLPYFIPLPPPIGFFGTMGAVIQMKAPPRNRRNLLDIGVAGPIAGLVVALPLLIYGLSISKLGPVEPNSWLEGNSILYLLSKFLVFGRLLPTPTNYHGIAPALYWLRFYFTGHPIPTGGLDVQLSPVAWAAWGGLLVTALNLLPAGMLDGGHLMYVLMGKRMRALYPFIIVALLLMGLVWYGWWLWAFILFFVGRLLDNPLDQITPVDPRRRAIAIIGLVLFFLVFMPVPLQQI
jgi:Zn-dependent protease